MTLRLGRELAADTSRFISATHSLILLAWPGAKILQFDGSAITEVAYEDTERDAITRDFLNPYSRRLAQLFSDDTSENSGTVNGAGSLKCVASTRSPSSNIIERKGHTCVFARAGGG
jgi:hypothetical protein